ncbi:MAG: 3-dehydroquinate synthase [Candidatus Puniceispirillales bacterium WSBS_2018_MAG_OTU23]
MTEKSYKRVDVELDSRSYPIHIGCGVAKADDYLRGLIEGRHVVVIADAAVAETHLKLITESFIGFFVKKLNTITVPSGEASKSIAQFGTLMEEVLALNIDRDVMLVALGGGVIGDLVGFVAASLLRGVDFIQIPTTLLAQVDSSVGGKTGINAKVGKNLIGAFHQPKAVLADISTLQTLPMRELRAGYAEVVKYGLLGDAKFFSWLDANQDKVLHLNDAELTETITRCCQAKAKIVAEDERESGKRALLNLGHTFGHAYEAIAGYDGSVLHGEAVAAGMVDAFRLGALLGVSSENDLKTVKEHLTRAGLPTTRKMLSKRVGDADTATLIARMQKDKKVSGGNIVFIVPHGIGNARVHQSVDLKIVKTVLEAQ